MGKRSGLKHTIKKEASYFLTLTIVGWADVFTRPIYKDTVIDSLKYCMENKGLNIFAYVIMTNHIHLLVNTEPNFKLEDTIRDFKRHTSVTITDLIMTEPESRREWLMGLFGIAAVESCKDQNVKFWQTGNHAIEIYSEKFVWEKINYIHNNPVKAKFVNKPEDWIYSSATNYADMESVLKVHALTPSLSKIRQFYYYGKE
ncbi:REP-associated tyrosine transposase [Crocinitomix catalasitica]|uniref:REP-associated tyrosine transposase n=1 Tax=Crocinitomix catalasitica TaxID=184607 RepID=UPI00068912CC|nr:transposase [Crocinitomix catalasitica]